MQIPSRHKCLSLIRQMNMLDHIVAHSFQVCRVAIFLTDHIQPAPIGISRNLIQAAALLHDITKTRSFGTHENHAMTGAQFLSELGYPDVGHIIGQHVRLECYAASDFPTEAEIVNYADKRVLHDRIVTLTERMAYILEKYATKPEYREQLLWLWEKTEELETKLFSYISFKPEDLGRLIDPSGAGDDKLSPSNLSCSK